MKKFSKILLILIMLVFTGTIFAACGAPKITGIKIIGVPQYAIVGEEFTLEASLTPEKASQKDVVWSTSDSKIATINESGKVTPLQLGTVIITAMSKKDSSIKDSVSISINSKSTDIIINNVTAIYDGSPKMVTAQNLPEGMTLVYTYTSADYPESEIAPTNAGIYSVKVYQANSNVVLAQCILTINPKTVVINVDDKSKVFGANDPEYTSSITGLIGTDTIEYTLGRTSTSENVGKYVITATEYQQNPNYSISVVPGELQIIARDVKIVPQNKSSVYGDPLQALTFEIQDIAGNALNNIDVSNVAGSLKIVTDGDLEKLNAGSYTISSADLISTNLNIRERASATYTITKRTAYVNVASNQGKFAGNSDPELIKVISNTAYGDDLSACLSREAGENVGFYQYLLDQDLNPNYNLAFTSDAVFSINANKVSISVESFFIPYSPSQSGEYIPADKLKYIVSINGVSDYATMDASGFIVLQGSERVLPSVALQQVASLSEAEKVNIYQKWKMTPSLLQSEGITDPKKYDYTYEDTYKYITKLDLTITASDAEKFYKDADPAFTFTVEGLISGDTASVAEPVTFTRDKTGNSEDVGEYEIYVNKTALQEGKGYYKPTFVSGTLTIKKRPIAITPISYTQENGNPVYYGEPERTLDYDTTNANLPNNVKLTDVFSGTLTKAEGTNVGIYSITIKNLEVNSNYELNFTAGSYEIIPRPWYVYAANKTIAYGDSVNGFLYTDEPYKSEDSDIEYELDKPIFSGKLALSKNQTLYANNLDDADETNDYYEIGQGNLTAGSNFTIIFSPGKLTVTKRQVSLSFIPQTYAYGSEQPEVAYTFSPALASGDSISRFDFISDNSANANIYILQSVEGVYNYSLEIVNSNNKVVNDCYTISINEQATDLFYVGASLLEIKIVNKSDNTSNTATITYGDVYDFSELFAIEIVNNTNNYSLEYTATTFTGLTVANPTDAGNYTISVITNPTSENVLKVKNSNDEDISSNFGFSIADFGMLTINKATLELVTAPIVDPMPYSTTYPNIHDGEYRFYNKALEQYETFTSEPADYILSDFSRNNVSETPYIIRAVFSPDLANKPQFKNFNTYTHEGLELYIIKKERATEDLTWTFGESFDLDSLDNGDGTYTVQFDGETAHNIYKSDYVTAGNSLIIPEALTQVSPTVAYVYRGIYFISSGEHRGKLPYVIDSETTGYIAVGNDATYRAILNSSTGNVDIYYVTTDAEGNEVTYLLDSKAMEVSSTAPTRAGIYYVTARLSTTNANYTFSKQDFSCLYLVQKAVATIYFVEENNPVTYNKDLPLELTLTTDITGATVNILGYKQYVDGNPEAVDFEGTPVNVGNYVVIVEVDTENYYIKQERGFSIVQATLNVVFGSNTSISFKEGTPQSVDFYFTANAVTLFSYTNANDNLEEALTKLSTEYPWIGYEFTLYGALLEEGSLPCDAQDQTLGYYAINIYIKTDVEEGKNYTIANAQSCSFSIIPKIYSGNIRLDNATINYDATYETEGGNERMYEAIYNAMVRDPNNELTNIGYTLTLKTNSGLIISKDETDFVAAINQAGKTFEIILTISGANTSPTERKGTLSVEKADLPSFRRYSDGSTSIDYTGQRAFNPLTDSNGNIYTPTIQNTAAGTWTYAEKGDADTYFGITYTYYQMDGDTAVPLADAPISIQNNITVQYKVVAQISAGANYKAPAVQSYTGYFTIAKTTFSFNKNEENQITYTYGVETDEITIGAVNKVGVALVLKFIGAPQTSYPESDGIVCLRYYIDADGNKYTSLPTNAGTYTVYFEIVSSKTNFSNEASTSAFQATKTLIINPRQIDQCDRLITYSSESKTPDPSLLYAKRINKFSYVNKTNFPDYLKELFPSSSNTNPYIYFDLYDEDYVSILDNIRVNNITSSLNTLAAGTYYFTLEPITDSSIASNNRPNFSKSDYYVLVIYNNPVTISFITGTELGDVIYDEDNEVYKQTVGYTAGANPFDVNNVKVTGRLTSDKDILTYSDYIIKYKLESDPVGAYSTTIPVTQGIYDVEIVLKNHTYISSEPLYLKYQIYAPTLNLSASSSNYTYQEYNTNNFIIDAYYDGTSRGQFNKGTHTNGVWILNQEALDAGVNVTYDGDTTPTNVTVLAMNTLADAQEYDPNIKLSTIAEFNAQNAGTYVAYIIFISSDRNFAPTVGSITFTIDQKIINYDQLTIIDGQPNLVQDTANSKFVYTLPITAITTFTNDAWEFDKISLSGPTTTKLVIVSGNIELEVYINYSSFAIDSETLVGYFEDKLKSGESDAKYTQTVTITAVTENTGNYNLNSLISNLNIEMIIEVSKGTMPTNVFSITGQTQPYDSHAVYANTFSVADTTTSLAFSNFVTLNTTANAGTQEAYKLFNAAYVEGEDDINFNTNIKLNGIYLKTVDGEEDVSDKVEYVQLSTNLIRSARYGIYTFKYDISESIYFKATSIQFTYTIEPKSLSANLSSQLIIKDGDLPTISVFDGYDAEGNPNNISLFTVNVGIRLASDSPTSSPRASYTQTNGTLSGFKLGDATSTAAGIISSLTTGENQIFNITVELTSVDGVDLDNISFANADELTPRKTTLYALYISDTTDLGTFDIYSSIDNNAVLEKILGESNKGLISDLSLTLEWSDAIERNLEMTNYMLTESVIVAMLTPETLDDTYIENLPVENNNKVDTLSVADKLNSDNIYDADATTDGIQGWEAPVYINIGADRIRTTLVMTVKFGIILDVTDTMFTYDGEVHTPTAKLKLYSFNYKRVFPYDEANDTYGAPVEYYVPILDEDVDQSSLSVVYKKNGVVVTNPKGAGEYEAIYTYTLGGIEYSQSIPFTISAEVVEVSMSSDEVSYDGNTHQLTATATKGDQSLNIVYTYLDSSGATLPGLPKDAGVYKVIATIDEDNYEGSATAILTIRKLSTNIIIEPLANPVYSIGGDFIPSFKVYDEAGRDITHLVTATLTYKLTEGGTFGSIEPYSAGNFTMKVKIADQTNYYANELDYNYTIQKADATPEVVVPTASNLVYDGNEKTVTATVSDGRTPTITYNGSTTAPKNVGLYKVIITFNSNTNYNKTVTEVVMEITPAQLVVTYTGHDNTDLIEVDYSTSLSIPFTSNCDVNTTYAGFSYKEDGTLETTSKNFGANMPTVPGIYTATHTAANSNYEGTIVFTIKINRLTSLIELINTSFTFNNSPQTPGIDADFAGYDLSYVGTQYDGTPYNQTVAPTNAGIYTLTATFDGNQIYNPTRSVRGFTIAKVAGALSLEDLAVAYNAEEQTPTVVFKVNNEKVEGFTNYQLVFADNALAPINVGRYSVYAYSTDNNYSAVSPTYTFIIDPADVVVELYYDGEYTYDTNTGAVIKSLNIDQTIDPIDVIYTGKTYLSDGTLCTENNFISTHIPSNAGEYTGTIRSNNYKLATFTFTIAKKTQTIAINDITTTVGNYIELAPTIDGLKVQYSYKGSADADYTTTQPTMAGNYSIKVDVVDANYQGSTTATLTINALSSETNYIYIKNQYFMYTGNNIALADIGATLYIGGVEKTPETTKYQLYNGSSYAEVSSIKEIGQYKLIMTNNGTTVEQVLEVLPEIDITYPSNAVYTGEVINSVNYDFIDDTKQTTAITSNLQFVYSLNGKYVSNVKDAGTYTASLLYKNFVIKEQTFVVNKQTVTLPTSLAAIKYGDSLPSTQNSYKVKYQFSLDGGITYTDKIPSAGTYKTMIIVDEDNYEGTSVVTLEIKKRTILFDIGDVVCNYTGSQITLPKTYLGLTIADYKHSPVDGYYSNGLPTAPGTYYVQAIIGETNYELTYPDGKDYFTLTINKFTPDYIIKDTTHVYDGNAKAITASLTINGIPKVLNITYSEQNPTNVGTYTATISVNGDTNYLSKEVTMTITPAAPVISYTLPQNLTYDNSLKEISAESSSGAAVTKTYSGAGTNPIAAGNYIATLSCPAIGNYAAAEIQVSFTINKARPTFNYYVESESDVTYDGTAKGYSTYIENATLTTTYKQSGSDITPVNAGTYSVTFEIAASNTNYYSYTVTTTFTIYKAVNTVTYTLPNLNADGSSKKLVGLTAKEGTVKDTYKIDGSTSTTCTAAGVYVATIKVDETTNYLAYEATVTYEVTKLDTLLSISTIKNITYDGNTHEVNIVNPQNISTSDFEIVYTGKTYDANGNLTTNYTKKTAPTDAGVYIATINFKNSYYTTSGVSEITFVISRKVLDIDITLSKQDAEGNTIEVTNITEMFDGSIYEATASASNADANMPTLEVVMTLNGATATEIKDGGEYEITVDVNSKNHVGYARRIFLITKQQAYIFLRSSAIEYGQELAPEYILRDTDGNQIETTNADPIITLYDKDGNIVTEDNYNQGEYMISIVVNSSGYMASGMFPFTIRPTIPQLYYRDGDDIIAIDFNSEEPTNLLNLDVKNLFFSIDGETDAGLLYSGSNLNPNASIKVLYSTIVDGEIKNLEVDLSESTVVKDSTNAYSLVIVANDGDDPDPNFEKIEISCLVMVGESIV